jgi:hypothetical protein
MNRWQWIVSLAVLFLFGCADRDLSGPELSSGLSPEFVLSPPGGGSGAIFTTTPDGGMVNENVRYEGKHYVYLDGGPPPNAPAMAAGLDEGLYVFQITDPSGKVLLSRDPARCRVLEVNQAGVFARLVPPTERGASTNNWSDDVESPYSLEPCHQDPGLLPDGEPGIDFVNVPDFSGIGRHDTNTDLDPQCGTGMVVQMMPFGTTPNPGGAYSAWLTPLSAYLEASGSDLDYVPVRLQGGQDRYGCPDFCAQPDPGFVPSNADIKTDFFRITVE